MVLALLNQLVGGLPFPVGVGELVGSAWIPGRRRWCQRRDRIERGCRTLGAGRDEGNVDGLGVHLACADLGGLRTGINREPASGEQLSERRRHRSVGLGTPGRVQGVRRCEHDTVARESELRRERQRPPLAAGLFGVDQRALEVRAGVGRHAVERHLVGAAAERQQDQDHEIGVVSLRRQHAIATHRPVSPRRIVMSERGGHEHVSVERQLGYRKHRDRPAGLAEDVEPDVRKTRRRPDNGIGRLDAGASDLDFGVQCGIDRDDDVELHRRRRGVHRHRCRRRAPARLCVSGHHRQTGQAEQRDAFPNAPGHQLCATKISARRFPARGVLHLFPPGEHMLRIATRGVWPRTRRSRDRSLVRDAVLESVADALRLPAARRAG